MAFPVACDITAEPLVYKTAPWVNPVKVTVFPEATVVSPFNETAPVPVLKVPLDADWSKLPDAKVIPVMPESAPAVEISHVEESIATVLLPPPMVTAPVDVPVPMLTGKLDDAFRFTVAPVTANPALPVMRPVDVNVPAPVRLAPDAVKAVVPPGARMISPVVLLPKVSDCLFVVASVPSAFKNVAPDRPAEMEAVGVPELTFKNPNFALAVEVPPTRRSSDVLLTYTAPLLISHQFTPPAQVTHEGAAVPPPDAKHWPRLPPVVNDNCPVLPPVPP